MLLLAIPCAVTLLGVVDRYLLKTGIGWTEELARFLLIWTSLLSAAVVTYRSRHFRVTVLVDLLPAAASRALFVVMNVVAMAVLGVVLRQGIQVTEAMAIQVSPAADADLAIAAAERHGVRLMVAYNQRFLGPVMEAKRRFEVIGQPTQVVHVRAAFFEEDNRPAWWKSVEESGGLALPLFGSHVIDTTLWWLGQVPHRVFAEASHFNPDWGGEDEVALSMAFEGGVLASAHLSFNSKVSISERFIIGTKGVMRISSNTHLWINGELILHEPTVPYSQGGMSFRRQLQEFVAAIREGREPLASARETRATMEIMDAARESMARHEPVALA